MGIHDTHYVLLCRCIGRIDWIRDYGVQRKGLLLSTCIRDLTGRKVHNWKWPGMNAQCLRERLHEILKMRSIKTPLTARTPHD